MTPVVLRILRHRGTAPSSVPETVFLGAGENALFNLSVMPSGWGAPFFDVLSLK